MPLRLPQGQQKTLPTKGSKNRRSHKNNRSGYAGFNIESYKKVDNYQHRKKKLNMKTLIAIFITMITTLIIVSGCRNTSNQGGTAPVEEEFSINVPSSITIKQGEEERITISLKRDPHFKELVQIDLKGEDIRVTPGSILVKASEKPDVQITISVEQNTALGEYRVNVKATPMNGRTASTSFVVKVISP